MWELRLCNRLKGLTSQKCNAYCAAMGEKLNLYVYIESVPKRRAIYFISDIRPSKQMCNILVKKGVHKMPTVRRQCLKGIYLFSVLI